MQRLHGGNSENIGQRENRGKIRTAVDQGSGCGIGGFQIKPSVGARQQLRRKGNAACGQGVQIPPVPQLTDGAVIRAGNQGRDVPVPQRDQVGHCPAGGIVVIDGNGSVAGRIQRPKHTGIGTADIRNHDPAHDVRRIVKPSAQKNQALKLLFPLQHGACHDLVRIGRDLPQNHGVPCPVDFPGNGLEHFGEKEISRAAGNHADGVGMTAHQIPGAVIGNIATAFHHGKDPLPDGGAHIGTFVQDPGNRADADAALLRNILDRHADTTFLNGITEKETLPETFPNLERW